MLVDSVLPAGLGLPQSKIGKTWIWPLFCLLGLSQRVQETYNQILLTSTLCGTPKCSKKCLSLCSYPAWLKALNLNTITKEVCEPVGFTCPTVSMKVTWRSVCELGSQSCFSAICTWVQGVGGTLCLHCATYPCKGPSWDSCTAELTHLGSGCCSCLSVLSNAMAQPRMGSFANWTFWHISLSPRGAQKINFLSDFTTGVFTQVLIMPSTEKDQTDAWRQLSSGSIAQNHLNPTTFVQDAVCSAYQSFLWIIFAKKKQTCSN